MTKTVKLEYDTTSPVLTKFANQMAVQIDGEGILYITFYQAVPPLFLGEPDEVQKQAEQLTTVIAEPVIRIACPTSKFNDILEAFAKTAREFPGLLGIPSQAEQQANARPDKRSTSEAT